jgi:serine/threonine protein kinase
MGRYKVFRVDGLNFALPFSSPLLHLFMLLFLHLLTSPQPVAAQASPPTLEIAPPVPQTFNGSSLIQAMSTVPTTHYVANDQDLWVALQQIPIRDLGIVLTDNIELKDPIWKEMPTIEIPPGRVVEIRAPLSSYPDVTASIDAIQNAGGKTFNFMNLTEVISVAANGTLAWEGVHVIGSPSVAQYLAEPMKKTRPQPYGLATFPSVLCDPGCQIGHNYTVVDYYDLNQDCSDEALRSIAFRAGIALNNASAAGVVKGASAVFLLGQGFFTFPVLDPSQGNMTVGNANVMVNTTVRNCLLEAAQGSAAASSDGDGDGDDDDLAAWAWALIGLAIAFVTISSIIAAFCIVRRRRRRKEGLLPLRNNNRNNISAGGGGGGNSRRVLILEGPPSSTAPGGDQDSRSTIFSDGGSSRLLPAASMSANAMDVAAAAAMDLDVAALIQLRDAWRSRIGRVHGLEFQEAVGRGGFGTVFKSTWRGTQVAVKLVEHSFDSRITKQIQREAALATSVSHPNIVVTYKVATAGLGDLQKLPHYVEVSAAAATAAESASASTSASAGGGEVELMPSNSSRGGSASASGASTSAGVSSIKEEKEISIPEDTTSIEPAPAESASPPTTSLVPGDLVATLIIMEFCDLGSMKDALYTQRAYTLDQSTPPNTTLNTSGSDKNNKKRDAVALLRTLIDVALGLDYLHTAAGVVHGDLKPGNVLLKSSGNTKRGWIAKLGDFGVARALEGGLAQTTIISGAGVRQGSTGGTFAYMSPEMVENGILTASSDTYAFGILMWEGWTGLHPFEAAKDSSNSAGGGGGGGGGGGHFFMRAGSGQRPPLNTSETRGMPEIYSNLMVRCWKQDMDARPAMAEVVLELREILKEVLAGMEAAVVEANNHHFLQFLRANK